MQRKPLAQEYRAKANRLRELAAQTNDAVMRKDMEETAFRYELVAEVIEEGEKDARASPARLP